MTATLSPVSMSHSYGKSPRVLQKKGKHQAETNFFLTLFQAMVASARATDSLDDETHFLITGEIKACAHQHVVKEELLMNLEMPVALDTLVGKAHTQQQKIDLYLAARLGVDPHKAQDSLYLDMLKQRLQLDDTLIEKAQSALFATHARRPDLQ